MTDTPQALDIVNGPNLREIELALTEPFPFGRGIVIGPTNRPEVLIRHLPFTIITKFGQQCQVSVQLWMIRQVGLPTDEHQTDLDHSLDLGLIMKRTNLRDIFGQNKTLATLLADDEVDDLEIPALYDYERKRGRIVLTNPPWRQLRP